MLKKVLAALVMLLLISTTLTGCKFVFPKQGDGLKVGDLVEVEWDGQWWNAIILEITEEEYSVSFKGFDDKVQWVDEEQIRKKEIPVPVNEDQSPYTIGDVVDVMWDGDWWEAEVLHVAVDQFYYVQYDDFDSEWDEWVHSYEIRDFAEQDEITEGSVVEVFWDGSWWPATVTEISSDRFFYVMYCGESTLTEQWVNADQIHGEDGTSAPVLDDEDDPDPGDVGDSTPDDDDFTFPAGYDSVLRSGAETEAEGLLFYTENQDGSFCYYYGNSEDDITHVVAEENGEFVGAIIFDENLYPVHWLFEELTMAAMWTEDEPFTPETAMIKVLFGEEQLDLTLDISMNDLVEELLLEMPSVYGDSMQELADDLVGQLETMGWTGLTVAEAVGQAITPHELTMASLLTTASVTTRIIQHIESGGSAGIGDVASADISRLGKANIQTLSIWGDLGDAAVKAALPFAGGMLWTIGRNIRNIATGKYSGQGIEAPTVNMLLCRGASTVPNYCNQFYLYYTNENIGRCVAICVVTLGCFTDICMPIILSVDEANSFRTIR